MKKLIAMIGAAAMAFGLFADPVDYYGNSFESSDEGVQADDTWPVVSPWSTTLEDAFKVDTYASGEPANVYATGAQRRDGSDGQDSKFINGTDNDKFLKLETGTNTLERTIDDLDCATAPFYFDQLVKFTGFEEDPEFAADTKIAVWLSAIETDNDAEPAVEGSTNLYVSVGTSTATTKVAIDPASVGLTEFKVDTWYRITVKSIGEVIGETGHDVTSQLGFVIFINGKQAAIVNKADYHADSSAFNAAAAALYAEGKLFTSMIINTAAATTLAKVGYQGIGGIDDLVYSKSAPDFDAGAAEVIFTVKEITGANIVKVVSVIDSVETELTVPYSVAPGTTVKIYYTADAGYRLDSSTATTTVTVAGEIDVSAQITVVVGYAQVVNAATPAVTNVYGETELYGMINNLVDGDTATFLKGAAIKESDEDEDSLYEFSEDTTIAVTIVNGVTTWQVESESEGDWIVDNVGTTANFIKAYTLADSDSAVALGGDIAGVFTAESVNVAAVIGVSGVLTAESLEIDETIALSGEGKVITKNGELSDSITSEEGTIDVLPDTPAEGWYTYQIAGAPTEYKVTVAAGIVGGMVTVSAAKAVEGATVTVTATAATGYTLATITTNGTAITGNTFTMPAEDVEVSATFTKQGFAVIIAGGATTYYSTLADAISNAKGVENAKVVILENCAIASTITVDGDLEIEIDDGVTVTAAWEEAKARRSAAFLVRNGATLTLDGSETSKLIGRVTVGYQVSTKPLQFENAALVIKGGQYEVDGAQTVVHVNGSCDNCGVTINDATLVSQADNGVQFNGKGTYAINNSSITGATAIYMKGGTLTIDKDSTITATKATWTAPRSNRDGSDATGDAIVMDSNTAYNGNIGLTVANGATVTATATGAAAIRETITAGDTSTTVTINAPQIASIALTDSFAKKVADGTAQLPGFVAVAGGTPYATLAAAVAADGDVTLLTNVTLTETLAIAKAKAINLSGKTVTFGDGLQKGITTEPNGIAGDLVISNGNFAVAGTRPAKGYAFVLYRVNALIKDVTMDLEGFEYGLEAETMLGKPAYWTDALQYAIVCENVDVSGNGSLFHFENVEATLDADCLATLKGTPFGAAHDAAIYSSCGSVVTVAGGTYEQVNALQTGDLGGTLIVNGGDFTGDIKSFMGNRVVRGVEEWEQNLGKITITAGTFDGDFVEVVPGSDKMIWDIKGGSFTADPTAYLAEGYAAVKNGDVWNVGEAIIATFKVDDAVYAAETNIVAFTPATPADPSKTGYTFTGWDPAIAEIEESTEFVAQFDAQTFTLTLNNAADGSATIAADVESPVAYGTKVTITATPATGYKYLAAVEGWALSEGKLVKVIESMSKNEEFTAPAATKCGFAVIIADADEVLYETTAEALSAVQAAEGDNVVKVIAYGAGTVTGPNGQTLTLAAGDTIIINNGTWTFGQTIVGTVTLEPGKSITAVGIAPGAAINVPEGYVLHVEGNGPYTYTAVEAVAAIDNVKFETFDAAWTAAQENDEIVLLADCTFGTAASAQVKLKKNLTLTLNGHVLTVKNTKYDRIYVIDDKTLTVDGSVEGSKLIGTLYAGIKSGGNYIDGNIVITGGTYVGGDNAAAGLPAIQSNGTCDNSSITATDATFIGNNQSATLPSEAETMAAYLAAGGSYQFTGCSFTGHSGIYAKAGTLTLEDCTVVANGTQYEPKPNTNGASSTGDAIIFDSNSSYNGDLTLDIDGNSSISSVNGYAFQETVTKGSASATLAVSIDDDATINGKVVLSDAFAAAVKARTASITGYAATVNNIAYQTVEEALLEVQALEAKEDFPITVAALAADGLTITDGDNTAQIAAGVTITITKGAWAVNDTLNYAGEIDGAVTAVAIEKIDAAAITLNKDASVTITGGVAPETSFFACGAGEGYEVKKNGNVFTVGLIQLTVTFDSKGGSAVDPQTVNYNETATEPDDPTKEDYTFEGWFTDDGTFEDEFDFATPITVDTTLYAKWTAIDYAATVTIGGETYKFTDPAEALAFIQEAEKNPSNFPIAVKVIKATPNFSAGTEITITAAGWAIVGDANLAGVDIAAGKVVTVSGALTYSGTVAGSLAAANITIPEEAAITIVDDGAVVVASTSALDVDDFEAEEGYKVVVAEQDLTKTFTVEPLAKVQVTVNATGVTVDGVETKEYTEGDEVTFTVALMEGFKGPITVTGATPTTTADEYTFTVGTDPITITATAEAILLTATFQDYNGTVLYTEENIPYNTKPTYSTEPTRTGYTFTGWNPEVAAIKVDTTYTATYEANTYGINYTWVDDDGAQVAPLANTLPTEFTFDGESIELKAEMVTLTKDYKSVAFEPATVTTDVAAPFAVTITLTKAAPEYPSDWPATDAETKAKFATWVAGKGAGAQLDTDVAKKAFLLNCTVAKEPTEEAAFKITAFTGTKASVVTPKTNTDGDDFNGTITVKAYSDVTCKTEVEPASQAALFFRAILDFPAAE